MSLPCGWETKLLGELILDIGDGGTPKTSKSEYFGGKIPWVNIQDISKIISETKTTLTQQGYSSCSAKLWPAGTVILSTGATIGEVGIAQVPLTTKQGIHGIVCNKQVQNWFLYYKLQTLKNFLNANAQGSTIKEVRGPFIRTIPIAFPISLTEQSKIAEVLSTVDKAIEQTEEMIAKQQRIKTGLMQDLLTRGIDEDGNLRSEETHELVAFSELAEINPSRSKINIGDNTEVSFIPMVDVTESGRWINKQSKPYNQLKSGYTSFLEDDVLFAKITPCSENGKGCHAKGVKNGLGFASTEFHVLRAKKDADSSFIYQWSINLPLRLKAAAVMTGSAGQQRVPASFFYSYNIPKFSKSEQGMTAKILSTVDDEIEKSEYIRNKLHSLKTALMQDLLTGRVRVTPLLDNRQEKDNTPEGASA